MEVEIKILSEDNADVLSAKISRLYLDGFIEQGELVAIHMATDPDRIEYIQKMIKYITPTF